MTTSNRSADQSPSAQDVADTLRAAIERGDLVPKQRLVETDLADEHLASRGRVRTALATLANEGLVERAKNRGARVRAVSVEEAVEIVEVRAVLEGLCARKAAERVTVEEVEELRRLAERMDEAVRQGDDVAYSEANQAVHTRIIEISAQQAAASTVRRLQGQAVRFQFQLSRRPSRRQVSLPEHLAVIDAVCRRAPEEAESAMRRHLASVAEAILETNS